MGLFRGGDGADRVIFNAPAGVFVGGLGHDVVKENRGRFVRGPQ
jgi:hypothetical protein